MADVACFCGCEFSFEGGAMACPRCGEVASVTGGLASGAAAYDEPDDTLLYIKDIWQTGDPVPTWSAAQTWSELDDARALSEGEALASRATHRER